MESHKIKNLLHGKESFSTVQGQPTEWGNFVTFFSDRGLISRLYKELKIDYIKVLIKNGHAK